MFPIFAYLSQEFLVAMWDGISVPFIEHRACAETKDTFLVTKRINLIKQFITLHYITLLALVWFA